VFYAPLTAVKMFHLLFVCPAYALIRRKVLGYSLHPTTMEEFMKWTNDLKKEDLRKLSVYLDKALVIRDESMEEFSLSSWVSSPLQSTTSSDMNKMPTKWLQNFDSLLGNHTRN
jgi:hypothetical protein